MMAIKSLLGIRKRIPPAVAVAMREMPVRGAWLQIVVGFAALIIAVTMHRHAHSVLLLGLAAGVALSGFAAYATWAFSGARASGRRRDRAAVLYGRWCLAVAVFVGLFGAWGLYQGLVSGWSLGHALLAGFLCSIAVSRVIDLAMVPEICAGSLLFSTLPGLAVLVYGSIVARQQADQLATMAGLMALLILSGLHSLRLVHASIADQLISEARLSSLVGQDPLTGLPNRLALEERLEAALALPTQARVALHYVDLDNFKPVNDRHGHPVGDQLLKAVAKRLSGVLREGDIAARVGGDEFVIIQSDVAEPGEALALGARVVEALAAPFRIDEQTLNIGASVGVALVADHGADAAVLSAAADAALYQAKAAGRGAVRLAARALSQNAA
jgi:diguanylate cyclase (GGDEF)-like protein